MANASPKPPKHPDLKATKIPENEDDISNADIVAEDIEAGYDIQSDASVRPLVSDPASSRDNEE